MHAEVAAPGELLVEADTAVALDAAVHLVLDELPQVLGDEGPFLAGVPADAMPASHGVVLEETFPPSSQTGQSWGWLIMSHSITRLRIRAASGSTVETTIPSCAGTMHDIWTPFTGPSMNRMAHNRHAPTLPRAGW